MSNKQEKEMIIVCGDTQTGESTKAEIIQVAGIIAGSEVKVLIVDDIHIERDFIEDVRYIESPKPTEPHIPEFTKKGRRRGQRRFNSPWKGR